MNDPYKFARRQLTDIKGTFHIELSNLRNKEMSERKWNRNVYENKYMFPNEDKVLNKIHIPLKKDYEYERMPYIRQKKYKLNKGGPWRSGPIQLRNKYYVSSKILEKISGKKLSEDYDYKNVNITGGH